MRRSPLNASRCPSTRAGSRVPGCTMHRLAARASARSAARLRPDLRRARRRPRSHLRPRPRRRPGDADPEIATPARHRRGPNRRRAVAAAGAPAGTRLRGSPPAGVPVIDVNDQVGYQRFSGLGAALTDSARVAHLRPAVEPPTARPDAGPVRLDRDPPELPAHRDGRIWGHDGRAGLLVRRRAGQIRNLSNFSIDHDLPYIIPTLQQALAINPGLQILANPWSPPGWMKANDSLGNQNDSGTLLSADYGALAGYFVKVIQAYAARRPDRRDHARRTSQERAARAPPIPG